MKLVLREDESGVSEVVGTILILGITVVLFSSIILWVGSIPTPTTQTRVDVRPTIAPVYGGGGSEIAVNITLLHRGVESLNPTFTFIYVTSARGSNPPSVDREILQKYNPLLANPSGLVDGTDNVWQIGERWAYVNYTLRSSDQITITIVDTSKNSVVWASPITGPLGNRPPIFTEKWTDGHEATIRADPIEAGANFLVLARVADLDGDLDNTSVFATITAWWGSGDPCEDPIRMKDDGISPDWAAGDGVFTLGGSCLTAELDWDGSIVLFEAKDRAVPAHVTTTRLILTVVPPSGPQSGSTSNPNFDTNLDGWSYLDWKDDSSYASNGRSSSNGNPGGYAYISTNCDSNDIVSGYYFQPFLLSGAGPFTATVNLDWRITQFGATGGNVVFYVFVDTSPGAPILGQQVWASAPQTGTTTWTSQSLIDASSRVPSASTYYLKIAVVANHGVCGGTTRGAIDNVVLTWTSTG